jgi:hypothetical protein
MKAEIDRIDEALSFIPSSDRNLWLRTSYARIWCMGKIN